jgi:hypothetical protein
MTERENPQPASVIDRYRKRTRCNWRSRPSSVQNARKLRVQMVDAGSACSLVEGVPLGLLVLTFAREVKDSRSCQLYLFKLRVSNL